MEIDEAIRFSFGRDNTLKQLEKTISALEKTIPILRKVMRLGGNQR